MHDRGCTSVSRRLCGILFMVLSCSIGMRAQWADMVHDTAAAERIQWWRDAKFGLFLHYGLYSIPGRGEWVQWNEQIPTEQYAKLANDFTAAKADPVDWAAAAKSAGMGYVVLTSRHHDGFALFDDPASSFTSVQSAAHRDIVKDYVAAVRKAGLRVGLYYSPLDWRYPGFFFPQIYRNNAEAMREQYHRQLHLLSSKYGKLDIVWFDGGGANWLGFGGVQFEGGWHGRQQGKDYTGGFSWRDAEAVDDLRRLQPSVLINDRTDAPADFRSREGDGSLGVFDNKTPWELCITITEGSWGWQPDVQVKPLNTLIRTLVSAVGRDGNLLLNVGPRPDGSIEPEQAERLRQIGDWLRTYGDSIYRTRGGPFLPGAFGVSTYRGKTVYLHILERPKPIMHLPPLPGKVLSCTALTGETVRCTQTVAGVDVFLSNSEAAKPDTIVQMTLDTPAASIAPMIVDNGTASIAPIAKEIAK